MTTNTVPQRQSKKNTFAPLIMDVAVPVGSYYLFKDGLGTSTLMALGLSSVVSAVRVAWSIVRERKFNPFASLILFVNVVGLALSFVSGDPRLMLAKDSGVSSAIGIGILVSVVLGKPMMTAGMKPWLVKGDAEKEAAWERLQNGSPAFRRAERVFSVVWGVVLLGECVVRIVGAYTLPVDTMVWLGTVIFIVAMALGFLVSGALAAGPMAGMLAAEAKADTRTFAPEAAAGETRVAAPAPALAR
ncbi:VC0807 family protein [Streptomyces gibsoniae]|uniref:VC0807 family protein n=1 Tax=Streptomyces gibsoniae TaxID=3075529 RepID=A0ABU2TYE4_9ACTN|nr:VC0807 family protein [Streptomyces sp. DSM 41699]MDT0465982.1 VC0807 family protein [Streptomyces sp. DSM 41699]